MSYVGFVSHCRIITVVLSSMFNETVCEGPGSYLHYTTLGQEPLKYLLGVLMGDFTECHPHIS